MIKITAEASFDLDERRKVWIALTADEVPVDSAPAVAAAVVEGVTVQAAQAYAQAAARIPQITPDRMPTGFQDD